VEIQLILTGSANVSRWGKGREGDKSGIKRQKKRQKDKAEKKKVIRKYLARIYL
jgi:hypothetical protein